MGERKKQVCCCEARTWALRIGWLESIVSGLGVVLYSAALIMFSALPTEHSNKADAAIAVERLAPKKDQNKTRELTYNESLIEQRKEFLDSLPIPLVGLTALLLIMSVINLVSGTLLITGVKQGKAKRLNAYIVSHVGFLFIFGIMSLILMEVTSFVSALSTICGFLINIFFIWVVNVHRKEILARSRVPVSVSVPVPVPVSAAENF